MEGDRDQKIAGPALQSYGGQHGPVGIDWLAIA
jgi:hypothetical protein